MDFLQLLISGTSQGCVYGLIALGFVLIYKATEMVNFAQGDVMMVGAFLAYTFINVMGWPFWWGFLAAVASMALLGMVLERVVLRPMIGEPPFAVLMITIGLGFVLRALASAIWGPEPRNIDSPLSGGVFRAGELAVGHENVAIIVGTALLCGALALFFARTRLGVAMQAASQNQLAAYYVGIPVKRITSMVWALAAAIAAVAGVLVAPISLIDPMMGFIGIKAFAAAIVGGFGNLRGAMLGGLLIGVVEQFVGMVSSGFADTSAYALLLIMLVVRPHGLFATIQAKKV
ncbi:MAG: branched-chain amino acid ABC transporter permease [Acidobacteriota bacterium]